MSTYTIVQALAIKRAEGCHTLQQLFCELLLRMEHLQCAKLLEVCDFNRSFQMVWDNYQWYDEQFHMQEHFSSVWEFIARFRQEHNLHRTILCYAYIPK